MNDVSNSKYDWKTIDLVIREKIILLPNEICDTIMDFLRCEECFIGVPSRLWYINATELNKLSVLKAIPSWGYGMERVNELLFIACKSKAHNNVDLVKYFVEQGADVKAKNEYHETPLLYACHTGNLELVNKVAEDETKAPPKSVPEIEGYWERLQVRRKRVHTRRGIWTDFAKPDERTFDHLAELKQRDKAESRRRGPPYLRLNDPRRLITVSQRKRINAFQAEEIPVGQHRDAIAQAHSRFHRVVKRSNELVGKRFYQRVHVDYRGRVYLNRNIVNWQGDDLARGLVQFAEGKTIPTATMKYLWIQAGNLWGAKGDAKALERAGKALKPKILQFAKNAFGTYKKWSHLGDDKWKFIRTCFEIRDRMGNPTFKSHLICELDQSMSGPQHMSLIMGDPESLRKCNGGVRFRDGYSEIAENVASLGKTDRSLKRRLVKTAFVPLIYGGDAFTAFLKYSDLSHDIAFLRELGPPGMMALAREVVEEIQAYIPAYQNYRTAIERWAREQWNADLEKGYTPRLHWTTPSGFPVYHYCNEPGRFETRYQIESDSERTRGVRAKLAKMIWRPPLQTVNDRSRDKIVKAIAPLYPSPYGLCQLSPL